MKHLITLGLIFSSLTNISFAATHTWEKVMIKDGISVFKTKIKNSDLVGFRGEAIIEAPIGKVIHVLVDNDRRKDWVDRLLQTKLIEKPGMYQQTVYQEFSAPWPVSNRDFVYSGGIFKIPNTNKIKLDFKSIDHPNAPKTTGVRGHLQSGLYIITPLNKNQTKIEVELISDPKGLLPSWIVNLVQKSWPYKTITAIKAQVKKPFVKDIDIFSEKIKKVIKSKM